MASSSSHSHVSQIKYDVFLSFRGPDTRYDFLSHLFEALYEKGIVTYKDDKRLQEGDEISAALRTAIEESQISLIVFSKDYASSKWCLEELAKITECRERNGQIVIPIFYCIDPSNVRHQTGSYESAFAEYEREFNDNLAKVQSWRMAMTKAANSAGFHSTNFGTAADLIKSVVNRVFLRLNHMYQRNTKDLVGITEQTAHLKSLLLNGTEDVCIMGIWGMGGIGKTTIAGTVYNQICSEFEGCCFWENVREKRGKYAATDLKMELLSILLENDMNARMPNVGFNFLRTRLRHKKVLVVLDDVDDLEQLMEFTGGHDWFGPGSRILVTTRDIHVLKKEADYVYEMKALNSNEALQLFNLSAFKPNSVELEFSELSMIVINYAKGLPLALKMLGSFLYGKSKEEWKSQLQKLKQMPHAKIQSVLRLSYDGLDREERNIFLCIACFFKRFAQIDRIEALLDACGYSTTIGLSRLQDKALIAVSKYVWMHDLIQEMGKEIVREESLTNPGKRNWLWDPNDIYQVLKNDWGTETIEGITLDMEKIKELELSPEAFAGMNNLKFLNLYSTKFQQSSLYAPHGLESLPDELRLLHWDGFPLKSLPLTFCAENLVELKMPHSRLEKLWDGVQNLVSLKEINLAYSENLIELPDFSKAPYLELVNLPSCRNLRHIHPSILSLQKLVTLRLGSCREVRSLRSDIHLRSLRELSLRNCSSLREFSVTSVNMIRLDLEATAIDVLPSSIGRLSKLQEFYLNRCANLKNLPNKLSDLRSLNILDLSDCVLLDTSNLHIILDGLRSLQHLRLNNCCNLSELPENIGRLSTLQHLSLYGSNVERLPASIKHLSELTTLYISNCGSLLFLPEVPSSLEILDAANCTCLEKVSASAVELQNGKTRFMSNFDLSFRNCVKLDEHALNAIATGALIRVRKAAYEHLSLIKNEEYQKNTIYQRSVFCFPGSKVPDWFNYQTKQPSVQIELPLHSNFLAFLLCIIVPLFPIPWLRFTSLVGCKCYLEESNGERVEFQSLYSIRDIAELNSDHVYLWYERKFCLEIMDRLKNSRANDQCTLYIPKVSFEFFIETGHAIKAKIKECGVYPIYGSDELESDATGTGVGSSKQNEEESSINPLSWNLDAK